MIRFSIVTITYNAEKVLQRTLDSVRYQTSEGVEHLIVDGASKDQTLAMAEQYKQQSDASDNGHKVIIQSEPDHGIYDAMNKGLTQANQEAVDLQQYFWYQDGTGAEAGAHVTEIPQEDFETTPSGGNLLMKSNKVALRNALVELASFGANGATIGQTENGKSRSEIT